MNLTIAQGSTYTKEVVEDSEAVLGTKPVRLGSLVPPLS